MDNNKEITLVKKGLFYYLAKILIFPFNVIFYILKKAFKYLNIYLGWYKEYRIDQKKKKILNKYLSINKLDEEII